MESGNKRRGGFDAIAACHDAALGVLDARFLRPITTIANTVKDFRHSVMGDDENGDVGSKDFKDSKCQ